MELVVIASLLSGVIALVGYHYAGSGDARRTRRVLRRARVVRIADLVDGQLACIVGTVERDTELTESMITRRPCVAFDTTVQFFAGDNFTIPQRVDVTRRIVPFFVRDDSGRVRIDAAQAALCNKPVARNERFEERLIEEGATVRLVGSVVLDPTRARSADHSYRATDAWTATITGTAKYPLLIDTDD